MLNEGMYFKKPVSKSQVRLKKKINLNILIVSAASLPEEKLPHSSAAGIQVAAPVKGLLQVTQSHWKNKEKPMNPPGLNFLFTLVLVMF